MKDSKYYPFDSVSLLGIKWAVSLTQPLGYALGVRLGFKHGGPLWRVEVLSRVQLTDG